MPYVAILVIISFLMWRLLEKCSWFAFLLASIVIYWLTILATNFSFPFWKIYPPRTGIYLAFLEIGIGLPITILNLLVLSRLIIRFNQEGRRKKEYILLILIILSLGILTFGVGYAHNKYQIIPINNFNLYLKPREYTVSLIKAGTLHGERSCVQNFQLYKSEFEPDECQEEIKLPEKYEGLSRNGKVYLTKTSKQLSIRFEHSTYGFGDGSIDIVYSSSDNGNAVSQSKWEIR